MVEQSLPLLVVVAANDDDCGGGGIDENGAVSELVFPPAGSCDCDWEEAVECVLLSMIKHDREYYLSGFRVSPACLSNRLASISDLDAPHTTHPKQQSASSTISISSECYASRTATNDATFSINIQRGYMPRLSWIDKSIRAIATASRRRTIPPPPPPTCKQYQRQRRRPRRRRRGSAPKKSIRRPEGASRGGSTPQDPSSRGLCDPGRQQRHTRRARFRHRRSENGKRVPAIAWHRRRRLRRRRE